MRLNKTYVVAVLILVCAFGAMGGVYQFYVKARMRDLSQHLAKERNLESKITDLQNTFSGTKPEILLKSWRGEAQPWADAVEDRTSFFRLGDDADLSWDVPEEKIARFYYNEQYPKVVESLRTYAENNFCDLREFSFDLPTPNSLKGTSPSRRQVSGWLARHEFGASMARMLVDAKASSIDEIYLWPAFDMEFGVDERIELRSTGLRFEMDMKDLILYLDKLRLEDRYWSVDAIKITNPTLRDSFARIQVSMVLTQGLHRTPFDVGEGGEAGSVSVRRSKAKGKLSFWEKKALAKEKSLEERRARKKARSTWEKFRDWLPF